MICVFDKFFVIIVDNLQATQSGNRTGEWAREEHSNQVMEILLRWKFLHRHRLDRMNEREDEVATLSLFAPQCPFPEHFTDI